MTNLERALQYQKEQDERALEAREANEAARVQAVLDAKQLRKDLDAVLQRYYTTMQASHEVHTSATRLKEAIMWLGMELKRLGEPNPYPNSKDPTNTIVDPTADGLKL